MTFSKNTIVALATPPGISGIAVIRISGPNSIEIIDKVFKGKTKINDVKSHTIHYGKIMNENELIDFVTISVYKAPNSYTGENVIEIGCHGGISIIEEIIEILISTGAKPAKPGEFTEQAFLNGKLDLTQIEAVADLIHSQSKISRASAARQLSGNLSKRMNDLKDILINAASSLELGFDFAEEDIELISNEKLIKDLEYVLKYSTELSDDYYTSQIIKDGFHIAIAGKPNAGKSTLFNAILKKERSIVSHIEGTTRDYIEESIIINDIVFKFYDTAGLRETDDSIEIEGIKFSEQILKNANMIILINDSTKSQDDSRVIYNQLISNYSDKQVLYIHNKSDVSNIQTTEMVLSAKLGQGIDELKTHIYNSAKISINRITDLTINKRISELLKEIVVFLQKAINSAKSDEDISHLEIAIAYDIRNAIHKFQEITGERYNEDILNNIFQNFCIGK